MPIHAQGRLLRVLLIDDEAQNQLLQKAGGFSTHLDIVPVRSWGDAQVQVEDEETVGGADILLVDISLEKDPCIAKAASVTKELKLLPIGPLLALPFIGQRAVMACIIYSGHLSNPDLQKHPFFLLAMGLIAARTDGLARKKPYRSKWLDHDVAAGSLDKKISEMDRNGPAHAGAALEHALGDYRERLDTMIEQESVVLANRAALELQLSELIKKAKAKQSITIDNRLAVSLVGRKWSDRIALRSLFADKLNYTETEANVAWVKDCQQWLSDWSKSNIERALNIIRLQEKAPLKNGKIVVPDAMQMVASHYAKELDRADLTEVFRLIVLFANAHEGVVADSFTKESVYGRLGGKLSQNRYCGWFGERGSAKRTKGNFDYLRPLAAGLDHLERCFLQRGSVIDAADRDAIWTYLRAEELADGVSLPYVVGPVKR